MVLVKLAVLEELQLPAELFLRLVGLKGKRSSIDNLIAIGLLRIQLRAVISKRYVKETNSFQVENLVRPQFGFLQAN
jgi:hypothetical protein